jgi:hypothetical protein
MSDSTVASAPLVSLNYRYKKRHLPNRYGFLAVEISQTLFLKRSSEIFIQADNVVSLIGKMLMVGYRLIPCLQQKT